MMKYYIAIALIWVIIIIVLVNERSAHSWGMQILEGYWEAPVRFCESSSLKSAQVYLQNGKMYILMDSNQDGIVVNKTVDVEISPIWWSSSGEQTLEFSLNVMDDITPLPSTMTMRLNPAGGMLGMYKDDILYLELYKDSKATCQVL